MTEEDPDQERIDFLYKHFQEENPELFEPIWRFTKAERSELNAKLPREIVDALEYELHRLIHRGSLEIPARRTQIVNLKKLRDQLTKFKTLIDRADGFTLRSIQFEAWRDRGSFKKLAGRIGIDWPDLNARQDQPLAQLTLAEVNVQLMRLARIHGEIDHVKLYARQINDRALSADATEFQMRLERRLGGLLKAKEVLEAASPTSVLGTRRSSTVQASAGNFEAGRDRGFSHWDDDGFKIFQIGFGNGLQNLLSSYLDTANRTLQQLEESGPERGLDPEFPREIAKTVAAVFDQHHLTKGATSKDTFVRVIDIAFDAFGIAQGEARKFANMFAGKL
jgi:hypothetical protein